MPKYDAFISYSHEDEDAAQSLQRALRRFGTPWYKARGLSVFRDTTHLSVDPSLRLVLARTLDDSRFLVLIASPRAAASEWVAREVQYWLDTRDTDTILIARVSGTIAASHADGSVPQSALPAPLCRALTEEPLYVDLSDCRKTTLADPDYRLAVAKLSAKIRGIPLEALIGEERRQLRRTRWTIAVTALVLILFTIGTVYWMNRAEEEQNARKSAQVLKQQRTRESLSRKLAARAQDLLTKNEDTSALQIGMGAYRVYPTREAYQAWLDALVATVHLTWMLKTGEKAIPMVGIHESGALVTFDSDDVQFWDWKKRIRRNTQEGVFKFGGFAVAISEDGTMAATGNEKEGFVLWDLKTAQKIFQSSTSSAYSVGFSKDGGLLVVGGEGKDESSGSLEVWDLQRRVLRDSWAPKGTGTITSVSVDPQNRGIAVGSILGQVGLWRMDLLGVRPIDPEPSTGLFVDLNSTGDSLLIAGARCAMVWDIPSDRRRYDPLLASNGMLGGAVYVDGGTDALVAIGNRLYRWSSELMLMGAHGEEIFSLTRDASGTHFATGARDGSIRIWSAQPNHAFARSVGNAFNGLSPRGVALDRDGHLLAVGADDARMVGFGNRHADRADVVFIDVPSGKQTWKAESAHKGMILDLEISSTGSRIASAGSDGVVNIWDNKGSLVARFQSEAGNPVWDIDFNDNGTLLAAAIRNEGVRLIDVPSGTSVQAINATDIVALDFSPHGRALALGSDSGAISLWNENLGRANPLGRIPKSATLRGLSFLSDGKTLLVLASNGMQWVEIDTGRTIRRDAKSTSQLYNFAQSDDVGAVIDGSGRVVLWDLIEKEPITTLHRGFDNGFIPFQLGIAVSRNYRTVAATVDGTVIIYHLDEADLLNRSCDILTSLGVSKEKWAAVSGLGSVAFPCQPESKGEAIQ